MKLQYDASRPSTASTHGRPVYSAGSMWHLDDGATGSPRLSTLHRQDSATWAESRRPSTAGTVPNTPASAAGKHSPLSICFSPGSSCRTRP